MIRYYGTESELGLPAGAWHRHPAIGFVGSRDAIESWTAMYRFSRRAQN